MNRKRPALWLLVLVLGVAISGLAATPRGSIRGFVYQDVDGDGACEYGVGRADLPVNGATLIFSTDDTLLTLYSGSDGSYGLVAAGQGRWLVRAAPAASRWSVISTNPLLAEVSATGQLLHTGVNFCLRAVSSGASSFAVAVAESSTSITHSVSLLRDDAASSGETLPAEDTDPVVSEALLSFPPASEPVPDLEMIAATPVGVEAPPVAEWLSYLNQFRTMAGMAALADNSALTLGSQAHARYMVINDKPIAHSESPSNPLFSEAGLQAAKNGNIFATTQFQADHEWAINFWISAPFHLIRILDPGLAEVGYGDYNEAVGNFHMSAVLDVASNVGAPPANQTYPIYFPGDGSVTPIVRHSLYEWPDPVDSCSGYTRPTGPPIILQLGDGTLTPSVSSYTFMAGDRRLAACVFTETSYTNPDPYAQSNGRYLLGAQDAIVMLPRSPLEAGQTYTVTIIASGQTYSWSFSTTD